LKTTPTFTSAWLYIGLVAFFVLFAIALWDITFRTHFGENDFIAYWSSTYLFSHGKNPYSLELMTAVQQTEAHSTLGATIMSWNPPTLFVFLLPLAWLSFPVAKFVWLLVNMLFVLTAALMLIHVYMQTASPIAKLMFLIFAMVFPAVMAGLYMGQVTFLVFWGLVACLLLILGWRGADPYDDQTPDHNPQCDLLTSLHGKASPVAGVARIGGIWDGVPGRSLPLSSRFDRRPSRWDRRCSSSLGNIHDWWIVGMARSYRGRPVLDPLIFAPAIADGQGFRNASSGAIDRSAHAHHRPDNVLWVEL
jgi:Glycosyltransferase family 87